MSNGIIELGGLVDEFYSTISYIKYNLGRPHSNIEALCGQWLDGYC